MALDLGTVLAVVEVVNKAIEIYQRIESLPQQMTQLGGRMERLNKFLVRLELFVKRNPAKASSSLYSGQIEDLGKLLDGIKDNATKVYDLFERYQKGILSRSMDLEFRAKWLSHLWFSLIDNSPEKIQAIMDEIEYDRDLLRDYMSLMAIDRPPEPTPTSRAGKAGPGRQPSPAPSPSLVRPKRDYKVLFVDPYNTERSVVAEALLKLFGRRTLKAGGEWRIAEVQSAGFFVRNMSDCVDVIDCLQYSFKSFKKEWRPGNQRAVQTALAAVFDNKWYDYPFKQAIGDEITARHSRGLRKDMFGRFDFIVVFTGREHDNMIKLKEALGKNAAIPRGKGRVLQLGTFLSRDRATVQGILYPKMNPDGSQNRDNWNGKVAEIKTALKEFLKREMQWTPPHDNDVVTKDRTPP
ncbi:hypothetical protein MFIFM68171_06980 [Madurella fahalii]|uniref:Uncharacterized protein n=1 Tax=Madurella fahalii TaxID=1157608 RepID=A0ABQ0GGS2_9PEZI